MDNNYKRLENDQTKIEDFIDVSIPQAINTIQNEYENLLLSSPKIRMKISFKGVVYKVKAKKKKKIILNDVSGTINPEELTAIIGASGAGKSTLLDVLAGYKTNISSGVIKVNDRIRNDEEFRKCCAYIMQEDAMLPNLTVLEYMMVSANLHLSSNFETHYAKKQRVFEILKTLGLEDIASSNVCDVSGGQRKRISIALELVRNPPVIFLDEPTSGLDSHSAYQCINLMRSLVKQGRTICCTIHQPSARLFELFDKVIVIGSGQILYAGQIQCMVDYFNNLQIICPRYHNPADFILEVSSGYYGVKSEYLADKWKNYTSGSSTNIGSNSLNFEEEILDDTLLLSPTSSTKNSNRFSNRSIHYGTEYKRSVFNIIFIQVMQFIILTKRSLRASLRDQMFTYLRLATTIGMALLLGTLYYNMGNDGSNVINNLGCIFFTLIYLIFICLMPTVLTFPLEKNVFLREHLNNWYSLKAYYFAKTFSDLPFQILLPIIYCFIMYYMSAQPSAVERLFKFMFVVIITVLVSQSIGLLLGAIAPNTAVAVFVAPVSGIPLLLFCGYFVRFNSIPVYLRWFSYLSYARYGWEGTILSLYGKNRGNLDCKNSPCMFNSADEVLKFLDISEDAMGIPGFRYWFCVIILLLFFTILRLMAYIVLRVAIDNRKK